MRAALLEQPVAAAQRALELADPRAVLRIDREHEPVEETPPLARRPGEQPVHRRRQPDEAQMVGEGARRGDGRAVDAVEPLAPPVGAGSSPTPSWPPLAVLLDLDRDREAAGAADARAGGESARRRPRPGENSDSASRRLVLPAPFSPRNATAARRSATSSAA